jgi:hypothetical protein
MDKEVIFENDSITIWFHNSKKIVHHQFHQFTHGKEFQEGLIKEAKLLEKKEAIKILSDDRKNPIMKQEDMKWTAATLRPLYLKAGCKYWAIVLPEQVAGQMAMKKIIKEYADLGVAIEIFDDPDKALKWLESH